MDCEREKKNEKRSLIIFFFAGEIKRFIIYLKDCYMKITKSFNLEKSVVDDVIKKSKIDSVSQSFLVENILDEYFKGDRKKIKKSNHQALADFLGVSKSAVSQYNKKKLELMLLGLHVKNNA